MTITWYYSTAVCAACGNGGVIGAVVGDAGGRSGSGWTRRVAVVGDGGGCRVQAAAATVVMLVGGGCYGRGSAAMVVMPAAVGDGGHGYITLHNCSSTAPITPN